MFSNKFLQLRNKNAHVQNIMLRTFESIIKYFFYMIVY